MKNAFLLILFFLAVISASAQDAQYPVIKGYGGIYDITNADVRPDPNLQYKIAIDLYNSPTSREDVNYYLERVARLINLHVIGGVPRENLQIAVVAHGGATYSMLGNEAHDTRFGNENPNSELINALHEAGVEFMVCGQSILGRNIDKSQLHPHVQVATSMLTAFTTLQLNGYAILQF